MFMEQHIESMLSMRKTSKDLATMGINKKFFYLRIFSQYLHKTPRQDDLYCFKPNQWTVLYSSLNNPNNFFENIVGRIFVPKFYHHKKDTNFLKLVSNIGQCGPDISHCKFPEIGRKLYEYKKNSCWISN